MHLLTVWQDISTTTTDNLQTEIPGEQTSLKISFKITRERWRAFRRRMCILRDLRKVSYGQHRKREYKFITKQNQTHNLHKQRKWRKMTSRTATAQIIAVLASKVRTHLARAREQGRRSVKGLILAVAVICFSWCRAVGFFLRAAVGCMCAVGLSCAVCVLAMWLKSWLQDDTYMWHDTSRRTCAIPIVVDRSNNSAFHIIACGAVGVFIVLSVLGLQ